MHMWWKLTTDTHPPRVACYNEPMNMPPIRWKNVFVAAAVVAVVIGTVAYGGYCVWNLTKENTSLRGTVAELQKETAGLETALSSARTDLSAARADLAALRGDLANATSENAALNQNLRAEQNRNNAFESQITDLSGTVGTLQKLAQTDPELLKKYSKVYFLSENYAPSQLSSIGTAYLFDTKRPQLFIPGALRFLEAMLAAAERDGMKLQVVSAYRSFYEQVSLKLGYNVTYGSGANKFSADQGYSEHQLGTTVDLAVAGMTDPFTQFEKSVAYTWLTDHAYTYGFALSYPKDNSYYQFEPWHWRFVGTALAGKLHASHEYFYNLTQRELDGYLISFFD